MKKNAVLWLFAALLCLILPAQAQNSLTRKTISTTYPATYSDWANGLLAGNGKMGVIVFGNPLNETLIFNDRKFFMAASRERSFATVSQTNLEKIRNYCAQEKWKEANDLANAVHGWQDGGEGNKHPGYKMTIDIAQDGNIDNYSRQCDFRTGEITVQWSDNRGNWTRRTFVSRKDNLVVQLLAPPAGAKLNCNIELTTDPGMHFPSDMVFTNASNSNYLNLRAQYPPNTNGAGYEGVTRIIAFGGTKSVENGILTVTNADSLLLLTRMEKYYSDCTTEWNKLLLQNQLDAIQADYQTLLQGQIDTHGDIFNRVCLDLNAPQADRAMSNEQLLSKQKTEPAAVAALWERLFDSGRYLYLSASSDQAPPDLLGLWTGDCNVGWSGYYHLDANLNLQIASGNIGDMPEAMEGYFTLIERLAPGFATNAQKLLGCRGMLGGGNTAGLNGLISALSYYYPYQYVTGEMGWLLYPFWEHYLVTGDEQFLQNRLYPLLRQMGDFYEDFLVVKDSDQKYIFAGSISPENQPGNVKYSLLNNATFDIAGAKFCLETLIKTANKFSLEQGAGQGVQRWTAILNALPPYLINGDGALCEWSWQGLDENYSHRHSSHMLPVWPLNEISKETTPELYDAAQTALSKKDGYQYEGAGHGILHAALNAANLNNAQSVNGKILRLIKEDFFFKSLASAHYKDFNVFCTDPCNTMPAIMMEMLVNSKNDVIELLPAIPEALATGSLSGLKTRNRVTVENLAWDLNTRTVTVELKSDINQKITLIQRRGIQSISATNASVLPSVYGNDARSVTLTAGTVAQITIQFKEGEHNLALLQPVTASSTADNSPPEYAVDGNSSSRWSSAYSDNEWIAVDFGTKKYISEVRLYWEAAYGKAYNLQVSEDGTNWRTVYSQTDGKGGVEIIPLNVTGSRLKMQGIKRGSVYGYSLWELEAYGTEASLETLSTNKAAWHSSAANYDNTAHLVTDGNKTVFLRPAIASQYSDSPSGEDAEKAFDGTVETKFLTFHPAAWLQYTFSNGQAFAINRYSVASANDEPTRDPKDWTLQASNDGENWTVLDTQTDIVFTERKQTLTFTFSNSIPYKSYRLNVTANRGDSRMQLSELTLFENENNRIEELKFSSKWVSATAGNEWLYIDLGKVCELETAALYWDDSYAKAYSIAVSNDNASWQTVYQTDNGQGNTETLALNGALARYVRLNATQSATGKPYELIEFEIAGYGGGIEQTPKQPSIEADGNLYLTGGNWKLKRAEQETATGQQISADNFDDSRWMTATVPGTVLTTYLNNGAIPDPNYADWQLQISDAYFTADFWYRNSFLVPLAYEGKRIFINFDGINWKADIYVNGQQAGAVNGAFIRGKFDITPFVTPGYTANIAVLIHKNDTPGAVTLQSLTGAGGNGGALGADNPTFHASVGWDWLPTIRGRNIGIHDRVFLSSETAVAIKDPFVVTHLSSNTLDINVEVENPHNTAQSGILKGVIMPGNIEFSQNVTLAPNESKTVTAQVQVANPKLWYPNGYGEQFLYDLNLSFEADGIAADTKNCKFGIREVTTTTDGGILTVFVNGKRIYLRGGNWGLSEAQLRLDQEGYDHRVRLHRDENFTMIRNWVGMTGSDFFYQACDKYGIMVWDDFWLANPADGPEPNDEAMFMQNARDKIKRVRNHPSVAFYCGRNEGNPPETLNTALKNAVAELDPTRIYIPHSADGTVSGFGPYAVKDPKWYFQNRTSRKLHSEIGQPNMPSAESMRAMLPSDKQWPINDMWGIHDFCSNSAQGATEYQVAVRKYGIPASLDEFCRQAQMVNMENHKAMFESFVSAKANGALMWMSQSAWPSTVWQTYDYYLEQTAGYYGCKKASEPLHIFMDAYYNSIKVANNTGETHTNLTAEAALYNLDGSLLYTKEANIASIDDEVKSCLTLSFPDTVSDVHFIKLKLWKNDQLIDENFYWRGKEYQNYSSLRNMEKIIPGGGLKDSVAGKTHHITARITNPTSGIALMLRLKVLRNVSGERVLPVFYSDNYFSLLPGESKIVSLEFDDKYLAGEKAKLMLEGWNVDLMEITGPLASIEVVSKPAPGNGISVYPNPTRQWLHVKGMKKFDVSVFDTRGSRVLYKTRQNDTIDLSPLPSGNYVVQLVSGAKRFSASVVKL